MCGQKQRGRLIIVGWKRPHCLIPCLHLKRKAPPSPTDGAPPRPPARPSGGERAEAGREASVDGASLINSGCDGASLIRKRRRDVSRDDCRARAAPASRAHTAPRGGGCGDGGDGGSGGRAEAAAKWGREAAARQEEEAQVRVVAKAVLAEGRRRRRLQRRRLMRL